MPALALLALLGAPCTAQSHAWRRTHDEPGGRFAVAGANDTVRGRFVMWGGLQEQATLEFDGERWLEVGTPNVPPMRHMLAMAFHAQRRVVVMFGGYDQTSNALGDTWLYDGSDWRPAPGPGPSARAGHAMTYDPIRGKVVLFGGNRAPTDTWEWDGGWVLRNPRQSPPAVENHVMAFDPSTSRVLLAAGTSPLTWLYDGSTWQSAGPSPALWMPALSLDSGTLLLTGGYSSAAQRQSTASYSWTRGSWQPAPPLSVGFQSAAFGTDPLSGRALAFGGKTTDPWPPYSAETRIRTATGWRVTPPRALTVWEQIVGDYDLARQRIVVCDGRDGPLGQFRTWELVGEHWVPAAGGPSPRFGHAVTYDVARGRLMLFGGLASAATNDSWGYGASGWTPIATTNRPPERYRAAMAYHAPTRSVVLFGGSSATGALGDTWIYDGTDWRRAAPANAPPPRSFHAMAHDAARGVVVMFGGSVLLPADDTWEWDGVNWTQHAVAGPAPRVAHGMTYDTRLRRVVLHGGQTATGWANDGLWSWDGTAWSQVPAAGSPGQGHWMALVHDPAQGVDVAVDGMFNNTARLLAVGDLAQQAAYGRGCFSAPRLAASLPHVGAQWLRFDLLDSPPRTGLAVGLSLARAAVPLPGGCTLHIDPNSTPLVLPTLSSSAGFASLTLPLPPDATWVGALLRAQAFALDPSSSFQGLSLSHGLELRFGR